MTTTEDLIASIATLPIHLAVNTAADVACGDTDDDALFTFLPEVVTCPRCLALS